MNSVVLGIRGQFFLSCFYIKNLQYPRTLLSEQSCQITASILLEKVIFNILVRTIRVSYPRTEDITTFLTNVQIFTSNCWPYIYFSR